MNYIAHAFFSRSFDLFMLGQLLGDFATRQALEHAPEQLTAGVDAHRALDRFTDDHKAFKEGCRVLETECHRYAPVVMDVVIDFALVKNWSEFSADLSFKQYLTQLYDALSKQSEFLPDRMRIPADRMHRMDWFSGFAEPGGLETVFYYMAKRVRKAEWIRNAAPCAQANAMVLEALCLELLRDDGLTNFASPRF